jgi:prepilin-type N-terminal cleavage/methylation domain-containing protein
MSMRSVSYHRRSPAGFTLIELLVVLAVLAAATVVAVQSLGPVAGQARYEATVQTLSGLRSAIVGPPPTTDGTQIVSGFVADVGRTPLSLSELLPLGDTINSLHDSSLQPLFTSWLWPWSADGIPSTISPDITIASGWRGPYVATPIGQTTATITDGWGRALNGPHTFTGVDWTIWSSGPNGVDDSTAAGAISADDIPLVLYQTDYGVQSLAVHVYEYTTGSGSTRPQISGSDSVTAVAYNVQGGQFAFLESVTWSSTTTTTTSATSLTTTTSATTTGTPTFDMALSQLSMGPVVIQAFHDSGSSMAESPVTTPPTKRSPPTVITLRPSTSVDWTLVMQ